MDISWEVQVLVSSMNNGCLAALLPYIKRERSQFAQTLVSLPHGANVNLFVASEVQAVTQSVHRVDCLKCGFSEVLYVGGATEEHHEIVLLRTINLPAIMC